MGWLLLGWLLLIFNLNKTSLGETGCLSNFPWLLRPVKVSTSSELYPNYFRLLAFLNVQASSFLIRPPFSTQSVRLPLVTYPSLCSTCVTYRTLCHAIGHQALPLNPYLGKQRISLGVTTILSMCLCSHT